MKLYYGGQKLRDLPYLSETRSWLLKRLYKIFDEAFLNKAIRATSSLVCYSHHIMSLRQVNEMLNYAGLLDLAKATILLLCPTFTTHARCTPKDVFRINLALDLEKTLIV